MVAVVAIVDEIRLVVAHQVATERNHVGDPIALAQVGFGSGTATVDRHAGQQLEALGGVVGRRQRVGTRCDPQLVAIGCSGKGYFQTGVGIGPRTAVVHACSAAPDIAHQPILVGTHIYAGAADARVAVAVGDDGYHGVIARVNRRGADEKAQVAVGAGRGVAQRHKARISVKVAAAIKT